MNVKVTFNAGNWFFPVLFLVFLVLKLTGVIAWSWWWVTAPLWIPLVIAILVTIGLVVFSIRTK
jgi:hypothetical protein